MQKETKYEIRPVVGYEGLYSVSNTGQVFSHNYNGTGQTRQRKPHKGKDGYLRVEFYQDGKQTHHLVHRLVLQAFVPNPDNKPCCDHIDTNRANNHVSNLKWATIEENQNNPLTRKNKSIGQKGKTRSEQHRKNNSNAQKDKTIYTFKNKETGDVFVGIRYDFYTKYDLNDSSVSNLVKGQWNQYKGWVLV